jgi:hypothetical protein
MIAPITNATFLLIIRLKLGGKFHCTLILTTIFVFLFLETNIRGSDEDVFASGQVSDLNLQLIQEQRLRLSLEERLRSMEAQLATAATVTPLPGQTVIKHVTPVRLLTRICFV